MASWSEVTKAFSLSEGIVLSFILSLPTELFHQICRISSVEHALLLFCFDFTDSANKVAICPARLRKHSIGSITSNTN